MLLLLSDDDDDDVAVDGLVGKKMCVTETCTSTLSPSSAMVSGPTVVVWRVRRITEYVVVVTILVLCLGAVCCASSCSGDGRDDCIMVALLLLCVRVSLCLIVRGCVCVYAHLRARMCLYTCGLSLCLLCRCYPWCILKCMTSGTTRNCSLSKHTLHLVGWSVGRLVG